jgi:putative PIN family toxin of toxin-antitoxin system
VPIVVDTNVLVSGALFPDSVPGRTFDQAQLFHGLAFSQATFSELRNVLDRRKFERYIDADLRERFLKRCLDAASVVDISRQVRACRDPEDDKFLEVAVNAAADFIVTGDQDLLALHPFEGIPIITPAAFLATSGS